MSKRVEQLSPKPGGNDETIKLTKSQLHDFSTTDKKGKPVKVKKEKKQTTTIKPDTKPATRAATVTSKSNGPTASKQQRRQIDSLIKDKG